MFHWGEVTGRVGLIRKDVEQDDCGSCSWDSFPDSEDPNARRLCTCILGPGTISVGKSSSLLVVGVRFGRSAPVPTRSVDNDSLWLEVSPSPPPNYHVRHLRCKGVLPPLGDKAGPQLAWLSVVRTIHSIRCRVTGDRVTSGVNILSTHCFIPHLGAKLRRLVLMPNVIFVLWLCKLRNSRASEFHLDVQRRVGDTY